MNTHFTFYSYYKKEAVELKTITWDKESKGEQEEGDDDEEERKAVNGKKEAANQSTANDWYVNYLLTHSNILEVSTCFWFVAAFSVDSCL